MVAQSDLCWTCLETPKLSPKDRFSHVTAQKQHVKLFLLFFVTQTDKNHISNDQINCYLNNNYYQIIIIWPAMKNMLFSLLKNIKNMIYGLVKK